MDKSEFLLPEQAAHTYKYLEMLSQRYSTIPVKLRSLFARCRLATNPDFTFDLNELKQEASSLADAALADPRSDELGLDPLMIAETHIMLESVGFASDSLCVLVKRISTALAAQSEDIRSRGRVRLLASRLRTLGCSAVVTKADHVAATLIKSPDKWLTLPSLEMSEFADHLFADCTAINEINSEILSLVALGELRNYRVDVGCKLLRLILLQGVPSDETEYGIQYVAVQRRRDGGYGFVNPFVEENQDVRKVDLSLHLPMTINAVWLFGIEATRRLGSRSAKVCS